MVQILTTILILCTLASAQTLPWANQSHTAANIIGLFNSGSCSGYLKSDGTCDTPSGSGGGVPSGMIAFIKTGTCPSGWTEDSADVGLYVLATKAANSDVGNTGGSTSYTPAGTVAAPTFTGDSTTVPAETVNSLTAAAQSFTGDSTTIPAETVNSLTAAAQTISYPANVPTFAGSALGTHTHGTGTYAIAWPGTFPTFTGSATTVPALGAGTLADATSSNSHKLFTSSSSGVSAATLTGSTATGTLTPLGSITAWPAAVPTLSGSTAAVSAGTPAGSISWPTNPPTNGTSAVTGTLNSTTATPNGHNASSAVTGTLNSTTVTPNGHNSAPAFSGNSATIQQPYIKMIPCIKN